MMPNTTTLGTLYDGYHKIHVPLVVAIAVFGSFSHVIIILILRRKEIISPTNCLLMSLSASEFCLLINYLFVTFVKLLSEHCVRALWNYNWVFSLLLNVNISLIFHTCGVFHVIAISVVRYVTLNRRVSRTIWFTMKKAGYCCALIYFSVPIICIPFYLNSEVVTSGPGGGRCGFLVTNDSELYEIGYSRLALESGLLIFNFWLFGIVGKLVPCTLILIMSILLTLRMKSFQAASNNLKRHGAVKNIRHYNRTTYLILTVMFLFVVVELPQGVLNLLSGILSPSFRANIYLPLGDIFEMLSLLYSSINFVIFCLMNGQFRQIFKEELCRIFGCRAAEPVPMNNQERTSNVTEKGKNTVSPTTVFSEENGSLSNIRVKLFEELPNEEVPLLHKRRMATSLANNNEHLGNGCVNEDCHRSITLTNCCESTV